MPIPAVIDTSPAKAREIVGRVQELAKLNELTGPYRTKIRDIMDGGAAGISRLVGRDITDEKAADLIPAANFMLKAVDRIGQKIGRMPDVKVDPPRSVESERAREYADRRARVLNSYDRACELRLQLPQVGRWLPGYGFVPWVLKQGTDLNGDPFPYLELRDPYNAYPGVWTIQQQPQDIAFRHTLPIDVLKRLYPDAMERLRGRGRGTTNYLPRERGGVLLSAGGVGTPGWANQGASGIEVYEYINSEGTYWVLPDGPAILSYIPNLLSTPPFVVAKRYSFNRLQGQYDQLIGLMAAQARLSALAIQAAEDAVNAETNIVGDMAAGKYQRGRRAVNYLSPGSQVVKQNDRIPFEVFSQIDRLERQIRSMATYPVTDDAISPNSFVTEVGLTELKGSVEDEYREYRLVIGAALELADYKRLEWVEQYYPEAKLSIEGFRAGAAFSDTYVPRTHVAGHYRSRRVYGAMAGFDDANKIIVGSVMQDKGVIDTDTFRENIDGLEDHTAIKARIHNERMEEIMYGLMAAGAEQLDPRVFRLIAEELPEGKRKEFFVKLLDELEEEEEEVPPEMAGAPGAVPDATTVLNRLTTAAGPMAGVQTVTRA